MKRLKEKTTLERPRFSTYMRRDLITKLKRAAVEKHWTLADVLEEAAAQYIAREEKRLGRPLKPIERLRAGRPLRE